MRGTLRVIPSAESKRPQRIVTLRQLPNPEFLADLLGGEAQVIETFDSILHDGEAQPCVVYSRRGAKEEGLPLNTWANMLWLQALVRKNGFSETDPEQPDRICGPVAVLLGDKVFMHHLLN